MLSDHSNVSLVNTFFLFSIFLYFFAFCFISVLYFSMPCPLKEKKKGKKANCPFLLCLVSLCVGALYLTACLRCFGGCFFPTSSSGSVALLPERQPWANQNVRSLHLVSLVLRPESWGKENRNVSDWGLTERTCEAVPCYKQVRELRCNVWSFLLCYYRSKISVWPKHLPVLFLINIFLCSPQQVWARRPWRCSASGWAEADVRWVKCEDTKKQPRAGGGPEPFWVGGQQEAAVTGCFPPFFSFTWLKAFSLLCPCCAHCQMLVRC